jgi:hypothetical protein
MEKTFKLPEGAKIKMVDTENNLVIYEEKEPKFKRGDFLISKDYSIIYDKCNNGIHHSLYDGLHTCIGKVGWKISNFRLMTDTEKSDFIKEMNDNEWDWDAEKLDVMQYVWKPKYGEKYYHPVLFTNGSTVGNCTFSNNVVDNVILSKGLACKSYEEANELYDAIVEFIKEWRSER